MPETGQPSKDATPLHISGDLPLAPIIKAWKVYLQDSGYSPYTIKAFSGDINLLAKYLPPDYPVNRISTDQLNAFMDWVREGRGVPCKPKTCMRRITSLKSFFKWLFEKGVLLTNPAERLVQHSVTSPLPEALSPAEVDAVLQTAQKIWKEPPHDTRPYALVSLLLSTGIKKGETVNIHLEHLALDESPPYLFVRYPSPRHRYRERKIPLPAEWTEIYNAYRKQYKLTNRLFPWTARLLEYVLEDLGEAAHIQHRLSFSICRWTSALMDLRAGMPPNALRQKLGISKVQWREVHQKLQRLDEVTPRAPTKTDQSQNGQEAEGQTSD